MIKNQAPLPANEMERIFNLADFDIDYSNMENNFKDLTHLAARIAGTDISLVNLIDSFTQWTVSNYGFGEGLSQNPREETICQFTIAGNDYMEIPDLTVDDRFKDEDYVNGPPNLRYYFGIPLTTSEGFNIGSLCVIDRTIRELSPEKIELLRIVADEVMNRLKALKKIDQLTYQLDQARETQKKVAHDIRGPIAGIVGLADIIAQQGNDNHLNEVLEFVAMIHKSGRSVLELADEILTGHKEQILKNNEFNLLIFKQKLEHLYTPQSKNKNINFLINISEQTEYVTFSKNKLLQIAGNLISNAIKFTPAEGTVEVYLDLVMDAGYNLLKIKVNDSGIGIDAKTLADILQGEQASKEGTGGEKGYGFGLLLVKHLVESLNGDFNMRSELSRGTTVEVTLRQQQ